MTVKTKAKQAIEEEINPTAGYIIIEPLEAVTKTASGIYLPETSSEEPTIGKVLAVGPDEITDSGIKRKSPVKEGDVVIYKKWGGNEVKIDIKEFLFVRFEDILAVLKHKQKKTIKRKKK